MLEILVVYRQSDHRCYNYLNIALTSNSFRMVLLSNDVSDFNVDFSKGQFSITQTREARTWVPKVP